MISKTKGQLDVLCFLNRNRCLQGSLSQDIVFFELRDTFHDLSRDQFDTDTIFFRRNCDLSRVIDIQPMQRNAISIKVLTFHRQERIDLNPVHPWKHQKVTRASSLITLPHHHLPTQLKFPYPSRVGIKHHAILGIKSDPHKIYLIVSMSICDIYIIWRQQWRKKSQRSRNSTTASRNNSSHSLPPLWRTIPFPRRNCNSSLPLIRRRSIKYHPYHVACCQLA